MSPGPELILGFQKAVAVGSQWHARRGKARHGVANVPGCAGCHGYAGGMCGSNVCNTLLEFLGRLQGLPAAVLASRRK